MNKGRHDVQQSITQVGCGRIEGKEGHKGGKAMCGSSNCNNVHHRIRDLCGWSIQKVITARVSARQQQQPRSVAAVAQQTRAAQRRRAARLLVGRAGREVYSGQW